MGSIGPPGRVNDRSLGAMGLPESPGIEKRSGVRSRRAPAPAKRPRGGVGEGRRIERAPRGVPLVADGVRRAAVVLVGPAARARLDRDSRLDALDRRRHPRWSGLITLAQAPWSLQGALVAAAWTAMRRPGSGGGAAGPRSRRWPCCSSASRSPASADQPGHAVGGGRARARDRVRLRDPGHRDRRLRGRRPAARRAGRRGRRAHRRSTARRCSSPAASASRSAGRISWPLVNLGLALLYLPMLVITWRAPEPRAARRAARRCGTPSGGRSWASCAGTARSRSSAFVVLYKLADNLAQALTRPFLVDMGYSADDRGVALATIGLAATPRRHVPRRHRSRRSSASATRSGSSASSSRSPTSATSCSRAARSNRPLMYGATGFESLASGMGTGAFSVLLLRLTEKRFSATQYALFSSLFGLPRLFAGPICGFLVAAVGWRDVLLDHDRRRHPGPAAARRASCRSACASRCSTSTRRATASAAAPAARRRRRCRTGRAASAFESELIARLSSPWCP